MTLETYEHIMVKDGFTGTKWENLLFFLAGTSKSDRLIVRKDGGQRFTFCSEILPKNLLQFEKKVPEAFLMGEKYTMYQHEDGFGILR